MNKNVPNILTISRIICTPIIAMLFLIPIPYGIGKFLALGIYVLGCLTDFVDGYIARKYNLISDFGKFMDQIADKFITTTALILVLFAGITETWLSVLILLVVVLRDILLSGLRMVAANKNIVVAADIYGKVKSLFLDVANVVLLLFIALASILDGEFLNIIRLIGLSLLLIGVALTIVSCVNYCVNIVKSMKEKVNKAEEN